MSTGERPTPISVLLIDDDSAMRQRLRDLIEATEVAQVVGEIGSVAAALFLLKDNPVDAVVLEPHLWDGDGCAVLAEVKGSQPACLVIVLTRFSEPAERLRCLDWGADHCFDKATDFERVPEVLAAHGRLLRVNRAQPLNEQAPPLS